MQEIPIDLYNYLMVPVKAMLEETLKGVRTRQQSLVCSDVPDWSALKALTLRQLDEVYDWFAGKVDFIKWLLQPEFAEVRSKGYKHGNLDNPACS